MSLNRRTRTAKVLQRNLILDWIQRHKKSERISCIHQSSKCRHKTVVKLLLIYSKFREAQNLKNYLAGRQKVSQRAFETKCILLANLKYRCRKNEQKVFGLYLNITKRQGDLVYFSFCAGQIYFQIAFYRLHMKLIKTRQCIRFCIPFQNVQMDIQYILLSGGSLCSQKSTVKQQLYSK